MINLAISGSNGRMGRRIIALAKQDKGVNIECGFDIADDAETCIKRCDVLIEFTSREATVEHARIAAKNKKGIVIGTTALTEADVDLLKELSKDIPIVYSPNMSVGVNLLFKLSSEAAVVLPDNYSVSMVEAHHIHKKDAPSGTAKKLAEIISNTRKTRIGDIPIESIREGEIIGDHSVLFESETETITLSHSAKSRDTFVKGAITAAKFISGKDGGLFNMNDVLGIK